MTPSEHRPRVHEMGNATLKLLATANLVGIGILLALAASLAGSGVSPRWTVLAIVFFVLGVICVVIGHLFAEYRARAQATANDAGTAAHGYPRFSVWKKGITWNLASLGCLLAGAVIGICRLNAVQVQEPQPPPAEQAAAPSASQPADTIKFIGLSNFKHVVSNSGFDQGSLLDVRNRAEVVCGDGSPKDALRKRFYRAKDPFDKDVCLDALYTTQVADFAWQLPLTAVTPADKDLDPDWPLGAMFLEIAQRSSRNAL